MSEQVVLVNKRAHLLRELGEQRESLQRRTRVASDAVGRSVEEEGTECDSDHKTSSRKLKSGRGESLAVAWEMTSFEISVARLALDKLMGE